MTEPTDDQKVAFIRRVATAARSYPGVTAALVVIAIAQAIQESGWGTSELSTRACNFYGAAADLGDHDPRALPANYTLQNNWEVADGQNQYGPRDFYAYPSMAASVASHLDFITGRTGVAAYQQRPIPDDPKALAAWLCTAPRAYATDPGYVPALCALIDRWQIASYAQDAITDTPSPTSERETTVGTITAMSAVARQIIDLNTGYGQDARWSFWPGSGSIRSGQMCDCSSAETAIVILGGYRLAYDAGLCTANLGQALLDSGDLEQVAYDPKETLPEGRIVIAPGHHVVHSMGGGWVFSASANERGTATGGQPGDQTGREVDMIPQYDMTQGGSRAAYAYQPKASATVASAASSSAPVAAPGVLEVDGVFGRLTIKRLQKFLGVTQTGWWDEASKRQMQKFLGVKVDGVFGPVSTKALQELVGADVDGAWGKQTTSKLQAWLNAQ